MGRLRGLIADRRGGIAVTLTLALLPLCVATLGAVDMGEALRAKVQLDDALDAAALAAAKDGGMTDEVVDADGRGMFAQQIQDLRGVRNLNVSFRLTDNGEVVEAQATRAVDTTIFEKVIGKPVVVAARSRVLREGPGPCVLALNPTAEKALWVSGSFQVKMPDCLAWVNSTSPAAFVTAGASYMEAKGVHVAGGASVGGSLVGDLKSRSTAYRDPHANLAVPTGAGCDRTSHKVTKPERFDARGGTMVFCDGLSLENNATFGEGAYVIRGGELTINAKSVVRGQRVTFVLTDGAYVRINGGADVQLTAPTVGDFAGLLFVADRKNTAESRFNGGSAQDLFGGIYLPKQSVQFNGNATSASSCLSLVADTINWTGNASVAIKSCEGGSTRVRLLE
jgi:hypothetical protein